MKKPATTFSASDTINRCLLFIAGKESAQALGQVNTVTLVFWVEKTGSARGSRARLVLEFARQQSAAAKAKRGKCGNDFPEHGSMK